MIPTINVKRLLFYMLPPSKRYVGDNLMLRVRWYQYLFQPMFLLIRSYEKKQVEHLIKANVTSEKMVLEWYLQSVTNDLSLQIIPGKDTGVFVGTSDADIINGIYVGVMQGFFVGVARNKDWTVLVSDRDQLLVKKELAKYALAGVFYEIIIRD